MARAMKLFEKLRAEVPLEEAVFPAIIDQVETLDKYKVPIPEDLRNKQLGIPSEWEKYLDVLDQADKMLTYTKVVLKEMGWI